MLGNLQDAVEVGFVSSRPLPVHRWSTYSPDFIGSRGQGNNRGIEVYYSTRGLCRRQKTSSEYCKWCKLLLKSTF